jgi:sec-independent protein translocase protein TatA
MVHPDTMFMNSAVVNSYENRRENSLSFRADICESRMRMMNIGLPELLMILVIIVFVFGAKRIPEIGAGLGKAIRSFNKGLKGDDPADPTSSPDHGKK